MKRSRWLGLGTAVIVLVAAVIVWAYVKQPEYAYVPPVKKLMNPEAAASFQMKRAEEYDVWGRSVDADEAYRLKQQGDPALFDENGAVRIDERMLKLGRDAMYKETFGNEVFLTDIMGIVDGPLTVWNISKAIWQLRGRGTTNLQVELAHDVTLGDKTYKKGEKVDTGIDVPKGAYAPLGMPVKFSGGRLKVGISCMACHATVDPKTKRVVEGAPNADLNAGLLMALATNSTAYFTHTDVAAVQKYMKDLTRSVTTSDGNVSPLPDPMELEKAVDANLIKWPKGNFDSTIDMKSNPSQIPDCFTKGAHPYGWSGFATAGPFNGLSTFSNNVHAQNSDSLSQADNSPALFGMDKELYLGTILQNAASRKYRYDPATGKKPSEFFAAVDPTPGVPGVNELVKSPDFPNVNLLAVDGLFVSSPGYKFGEQVNAMSAYQNRLAASPKEAAEPETVRRGRDVFVRAGCMSCHAGEALTNHRIVPAPEIGTEPSRAQALKSTGSIFGRPSAYSYDTPVPVPPGAKTVEAPTGHLDREQIRLGFAHQESPGGYKVKGLIGLYWSAPYLHDGGVAVGPDANAQLGIPGTLAQGVAPDAHNSLQALVDRQLRRKVVEANRSSRELADVHVQGIGHEFWVDETAGFTKEDQEALIRYLLSLKSSAAP